MVTTLFILISTGALAQSSTPSFWDDPFNSPMLTLVVVLALLSVTIVLMIFLVFYLLRVMNILTHEAEVARAKKLGLPLTVKQSWFEQWLERFNASVPVAKEADIDTGHSYDGIRELDNHLPPWWKGLFYGTIAWAVVYLIAYHVTNSLPLSEEEYRAELASADEQARILRASRPVEAIDENTLSYSPDPTILENGRKVFASSNCGQCHRNDGAGNNIGPNLTDQYWIHGGSIKNIFVTINKGVVEKGMPAWGRAMSAQDVRNVAFYIMSLQGSNPANPKAPQGDLFEQPPIATDSVKASGGI